MIEGLDPPIEDVVGVRLVDERCSVGRDRLGRRHPVVMVVGVVGRRADFLQPDRVEHDMRPATLDEHADARLVLGRDVVQHLLPTDVAVLEIRGRLGLIDRRLRIDRVVRSQFVRDGCGYGATMG